VSGRTVAVQDGTRPGPGPAATFWFDHLTMVSEGRHKTVSNETPRANGSSRIAFMAIFFHLCAFASIFDIYFRSPIINGLDAVELPSGAQARRVVVFIADGGRADMFFQIYNG
jgi:hypothetical protein